MSISNIKDIVDSELEGRVRRYWWRKTPSQATQGAIWFDLSMSPGSPAPQYYIGSIGTATLLKQSTDGGIFHGANTSPEQQYLRKTVAMTTTATALPLTMILCDYLMFYPFCDESTTEEQIMINSTSLSRYTDGEGVRVMAVSVAGRTGGQSFFFTYTNQDGTSGRVSKTVIENAFASNGTIVTSATATAASASPFIGLQEGDTGVRSIESVTMLGADVGLFALVLVKPLGQTTIKEITAPVEKDYLIQGGVLPEVEDDAYLNWLCLPQGTLAATALVGDLQVIWK